MTYKHPYCIQTFCLQWSCVILRQHRSVCWSIIKPSCWAEKECSSALNWFLNLHDSQKLPHNNLNQKSLQNVVDNEDVQKFDMASIKTLRNREEVCFTLEVETIRNAVFKRWNEKLSSFFFAKNSHELINVSSASRDLRPLCQIPHVSLPMY